MTGQPRAVPQERLEAPTRGMRSWCPPQEPTLEQNEAEEIPTRRRPRWRSILWEAALGKRAAGECVWLGSCVSEGQYLPMRVDASSWARHALDTIIAWSGGGVHCIVGKPPTAFEQRAIRVEAPPSRIPIYRALSALLC